MHRRNFFKDAANTIRSNIQKDRKSTHKTISLLRETDKTLDSINDMISPPSIWMKLSRTVRREALYASATAWQLSLTLAIYLVIFWIILAIIF